MALRSIDSAAILSSFAIVIAACGSDASAPAADAGAAPTEGGTAKGDGGVIGDDDGSAIVPPGPPAATCDSPIAAIDVSTPTTVVGTGAGTCTEDALRAAIAKGGVVTFNCGDHATIAVTSELTLNTKVDTVIDGGGKVTLDGGGKTRIIHFDAGNFRATKTTVTLQHLALDHGKSSGTAIPSAPPPCSQGVDTDGGGGAVLVRDGVLHVIDCTFTGNAAATPGPDVAGGAIYAIGALDVTIAGSTFVQNSGSNGGAVGSLFSNLTIVNDTFAGNEANGSGANTIDPKCTADGGESGNGGNGGAVVIDGGEDFAVVVCGSTFTANKAGALGGAFFRTPDIGRETTRVDRSTFDGNTAKSGGGAMYLHHTDLAIVASTYSNNSASGAGAIQADDTVFDFSNVTFAGNKATTGLGGAISLFGNGGKVAYCTFTDNHADAGSGIFGAAIAGGTALTITNSVFDGNTSQDCGAPMTCADGNSTGDGNVQWPQNHAVCASADPACASGTTFADPKLGALSNNGGTTRTALPGAGSAAIGAGKGCSGVDQRGHTRKVGDGCTAGAVEIP